MDVKSRGKILTTTYTCTNCTYTNIEKMKLGESSEQADPNFERDRKIFCLSDERAAIVRDTKYKWEALKRMTEEQKEREEKKEVYDIVGQLKLLKVADLIELLRPPIEKAGFTEVRFEKPITAPEFSVEFSCLDSETKRTDYQSRAVLKKVIVKALAKSNWRLMSNGISYRLGYLSGRVRAYEDEKDLVRLVEREK